jgi:predicted metalloprotease
MMTKNQKIALGCGGGGCLGLILLVIICAVLIVSGVIKAPGIYSSNSNYNYNSNRNSNYNSNANDNANTNTSSSSAVSDDDKHKLYQAAAVTQDQALMHKVWEKLGLMKTDGTPTDEYGPFLKEHFKWIFSNTDFIQSINTPEKARAYVDAHMED